MANDTETITIQDFISHYGIRFECRRVDSRPDGAGDWSEDARHFRCRIISVKDHESCSVCHVLQRHHEYASKEHEFQSPRGKSFALYFSQGSAHTADPTLADVLDCLASHAREYENARQSANHAIKRIYTNEAMQPTAKPSKVFQEWASEYDYDADSRKAEKTFRAIKRQSEQLKRTLGQEAYEELLWKVERLGIAEINLDIPPDFTNVFGKQK
ncbi:MAG TPA: hypothetical protein VI386_17820 [Candidatus Sulfotelmatobacter sp.]